MIRLEMVTQTAFALVDSTTGSSLGSVRLERDWYELPRLEPTTRWVVWPQSRPGFGWPLAAAPDPDGACSRPRLEAAALRVFGEVERGERGLRPPPPPQLTPFGVLESFIGAFVDSVADLRLVTDKGHEARITEVLHALVPVLAWSYSVHEQLKGAWGRAGKRLSTTDPLLLPSRFIRLVRQASLAGAPLGVAKDARRSWASTVGADAGAFLALDWVRGQIQHQGAEAIAFRQPRPGMAPFWVWREPAEFRVGRSAPGEAEFEQHLAGRHLANSLSQVDVYVDALYSVLFALAEWDEINAVTPDSLPIL